MSNSMVFVADTDLERLETMRGLLTAAEPVRIETFSDTAGLRRAIRESTPRLMIGPWTLSGETLLAIRSLMRNKAPRVTPPMLLLLTEHVTPAKIALAHSAGHAELIPSDPLDTRALLNRVILLLHGASSLGALSLPTLETELPQALQRLPALRRRLAA